MKEITDKYNHFNVEIKYKKDGTPHPYSIRTQEYIERDIAVLESFDNNPDLFLHHTSARFGFISRTNGCVINKYKGRYGEGFTVDIPHYGKASQYHERRYYIYKEIKEKAA